MLDEFDKIAKKDQSGGSGGGDGRRDVAGEGVQQSLLKLVEGTKIQLTLPPSSQRGFGVKPLKALLWIPLIFCLFSWAHLLEWRSMLLVD